MGIYVCVCVLCVGNGGSEKVTKRAFLNPYEEPTAMLAALRGSS